MFVGHVRLEEVFVAKFLVAQFAIGFVIEDSQTVATAAAAVVAAALMTLRVGRRSEFVIEIRSR